VNTGYERRRSPPAVIRLLLGFVVFLVAAAAALAVLAWQQTSQIRVLEDEVGALEEGSLAFRAQQAALQATTTTMENRLAFLEASDPAQQIAALQSAVDSADTSQEFEELRTTLLDIRQRVDAFQADLDGLSASIAAMQPTDVTNSIGSPDSEARLSVVAQRQSHNLSCESSAASMVAGYHGLSLTEAQVLAALPRNDNPHLGFRGNIDGPTGGIEDYGVYAGPIMAILNSRGLSARSVEGGLNGIKAAIARGNPVIAWVTYNCLPSSPSVVSIDGVAVTLVPNQHVVVVTGYTPDGIWANDPWDGEEDFYATADFERAMAYFGNMALEVAVP
jgi:uncharacterized protein YvpB